MHEEITFNSSRRVTQSCEVEDLEVLNASLNIWDVEEMRHFVYMNEYTNKTKLIG